MKFTGGQSYIQCQKHILSRTMSVKREEKCKCEKKEHYSCPNLNCKLCICKRCAGKKDDTTVYFVTKTKQDREKLIADSYSAQAPKNPRCLNFFKF